MDLPLEGLSGLFINSAKTSIFGSYSGDSGTGQWKRFRSNEGRAKYFLFDLFGSFHTVDWVEIFFFQTNLQQRQTLRICGPQTGHRWRARMMGKAVRRPIGAITILDLGPRTRSAAK